MCKINMNGELTNYQANFLSVNIVIYILRVRKCKNL